MKSNPTTHIIFEQRGGKKNGGEEDKTLELEFYRIVNNQHYLAEHSFKKFEILIVPKSANFVGLQIADLIARPIGVHFVNIEQKNRAYDIIREKFMDKSNIDPRHDGIKIFPYY